MSTYETHGWGVTQRRIGPEGEAARKDALAWLEANADENAYAEVVLRRVPDASGGVGLARAGGGLAGVVVTTGPTAYVEATDDGVVAGLLDGVADGLARVWCRAGLRGAVERWLAANGGVGDVRELRVVRAGGAVGGVDEGVRHATMGDLSALEAYARAYADERGDAPTRDLPSLVARREVAVVDADGAPACVGLHLGRTSRLALVGAVRTRPEHRRAGLATRVLGALVQEAVAVRSVVQGLVDADDDAGAALARACGFDEAGGLCRFRRADGRA